MKAPANLSALSLLKVLRPRKAGGFKNFPSCSKVIILNYEFEMTANILLWVGIALIVIGWVELARQSAKVITHRKENERFPEKQKGMLYKRNICRLTMIGGIVMIIISVFI